MISLYPDQIDLVNRTRKSMVDGHRAPLLVAPCGAGKTVMFSYFSRQIMSKGKRVLILVHRDELLDQVADTLNKFNVGYSFIAANRNFSARSLVHIASVFTLAKRLNRVPPPDVIIVDEAHHSSSGSTWDKIFKAYPKAWRIGVTASPIRLSGEALGDSFDDIIVGPSTRELIDQGRLCEYKLYCSQEVNTSNIHTVMGDFNKKEIDELMNKPTITGNAVAEYTKYAKGKRAVVFCCSIKHSESVAEEFRKAGYPTGSIDGKMDTYTRKRIVSNFRTGIIQILTSVNVISEGFDLPAIEVAIILRPTQSLGMWIQMCGRALRKFPGKEYAIILDHASNTKRLQWLPCSTGEWSLSGRRKKPKESDGPKVKLCPECFFCMPSWRKDCPECKFVFVPQEREVDHVQGDLTEIDVQKMRRERLKTQGRAQTREELIELGRKRGYKSPEKWAWAVINGREKRKESSW